MGKGQIIDIIIILQCGAERKEFLTVATCLCSFFHKKEHRSVHRDSGVPK